VAEDPAALTALSGNVQIATACSDVFFSLVGLVPRQLRRKQLWQMVDEPLRTVALRMAATLEGSYLDAATVTALGVHLREAQHRSERLFTSSSEHEVLWGTRLTQSFFDSVLRSMPVGERDIHWTEWVRRNYADKWGTNG